jgi:hypothetical protein
VPHPGRVDEEAAVLRVLDEGLVEPRLSRVGVVDDEGEVVGDEDLEDAAEELLGRLAALDHGLGGLGEGEIDEAEPGQTRREDERVADPAALGRDDEADQLVGELLVVAVGDDAGLGRRLDVAAHGLSVEADLLLDRTQPLATEPQPQHFSNLEHPHLPKGHRRSLVR